MDDSAKLAWILLEEYMRLCIADDLARIARGEQPVTDPRPERWN